LRDSVYSLSVREETSGTFHESEPFTVCSDSLLLKETCLIQYSNEDNNSSFDNIFWIDGVQQVFEFRVEGGFKPEGVSPKVDNEQFRNQYQEIVELYSVPYNTYTLTCGNASGIPYWIVLFINDILSLSYFIVGKERYVRSGNSVPEKTQISEDGQMFNMTILLEKSTNDYFMISPKSMQVSAEASSCVARIRSNMGWSFVITEESSFISSKEKNRGRGSKDLVFDIGSNGTDSSRTGKVKFTTEEGLESYLTINQKKPGVLTLSPDTIQDIPKNGGNYDIFITSSGNWTCIDTPLWAVPNIYTGEVGKAIVNIDVEMNESGSERSGVMTFKLDDDDKVSTLVIKQLAQDDYIIIDPNPINIPKDTYSDIINVIASGSWRITSNPSWVDISPSDGMEGHNNVSIDITANVGNTRTGRIEFALDDKPDTVGTLIIKQEGNEPLVITPDTIHGIPASGGSYEVTIKATGNWTCSYNPTWARPDNGSGAAGETTFTLDIDVNTGNSRGDRLEFELDDTGYVVELDVLQDAGASTGIGITPIALTFPPTGGVGRVAVVVQEGQWEARNIPNNVYVAPNNGKPTLSYMHVLVDKNSKDSAFVDSIEIVNTALGAKQVLQIGQNKMPAEPMTLTSKVADNVVIPSTGYTYMGEVSSTAQWVIEGYDSGFMSVSADSGEAGKTDITVYIGQNDTGSLRACQFKIRNEETGECITHSWIQETATSTGELLIGRDSLTVNKNPYGITNYIISALDWEILSIPEWVKMYPENGKAGYTDVIISVDENTTGSPRVGNIVVTAGGVDEGDIEITQR
jgi:hypothetical protein